MRGRLLLSLPATAGFPSTRVLSARLSIHLLPTLLGLWKRLASQHGHQHQTVCEPERRGCPCHLPLWPRNRRWPPLVSVHTETARGVMRGPDIPVTTFLSCQLHDQWPSSTDVSTAQRVLGKASKTSQTHVSAATGIHQWAHVAKHKSMPGSTNTPCLGPTATLSRPQMPTGGESALSPSRKVQTPVTLPQSRSPQSSVRLATRPRLRPRTPGTAGPGTPAWA